MKGARERWRCSRRAMGGHPRWSCECTPKGAESQPVVARIGGHAPERQAGGAERERVEDARR